MHGRNNDGDASGFEAAMRGGSIIIASQGRVGVERRNLSASRDWAEHSARLIAFELSHDGIRRGRRLVRRCVGWIRPQNSYYVAGVSRLHRRLYYLLYVHILIYHFEYTTM